MWKAFVTAVLAATILFIVGAESASAGSTTCTGTLVAPNVQTLVVPPRRELHAGRRHGRA
jgi:hypothetical protein